MNPREVTVLRCGFCQKTYDLTGLGRDQAAACCQCPTCGWQDSYTGMFKKCHVCRGRELLAAAEAILVKAREEVDLQREWLTEAEAKRGLVADSAISKGGGR